MIRRFLIVLFLGVFLSNALPFGVRAETMSPNMAVQVCGAYRYDVERVIDGLLIKVTDGARVRSLFHRDVSADYGSQKTSVISGCDGISLALVEYDLIERYSHNETVFVIDPSGREPQRKNVGIVTKNANTTIDPEVFVPEHETERLKSFLSHPRMEQPVANPSLVYKKHIQVEKVDFLNDRRYAAFAQDGRVVYGTASSNWNTTVALDSRVCANGTTYVLYAKMFANGETEFTSTYPSNQYLIERSGKGHRTLIPIPYVQDAWRSLDTYPGVPELGRCFGEHVGLFFDKKILIVSPQTTSIDYLNPRTSLDTYAPEPSSSDQVSSRIMNLQDIRVSPAGYWIPGRILRGNEGVRGSGAILLLNTQGSVTRLRPAYYRDMRQYPVDTQMNFFLDPQGGKNTTVQLILPGSDAHGDEVESYHEETNGIYHEVARNDAHWQKRVYTKYPFTPLYVSADKGGLTIKSHFLKQPMLLHGLPNTPYSLQWYRVGPLELDGTRKVWYAFSVNGNTQTWFAVVR